MNTIRSWLMNNPSVLSFFWKACRCILSLVSIFVKVDNKLIIFCSYGGRKFDDSPKALYDYISQDHRFEQYKLVWIFNKPELHPVNEESKVRMNSWQYFRLLLTAKVWVDNTGGLDHGIGFYRRDTIKILTWHGSPIKKICGDEENSSPFSKIKNSYDDISIRCAFSDWDSKLFARLFNCDANRILRCGLPRNDEINKYSLERIYNIKSSLRILQQKKIILYLPTYREYVKNAEKQIVMKPPIDFNKWKETLGENYIVLFRAHYEVAKVLDLKEDDFVRDVSSYPYINDLYAISDMLISDYTSAYFDYSISNKPMLCYAYDLEEYSRERGLYFELDKLLPCPIDQNETDLLDHIMNIDKYCTSAMLKEFKSRYAPSHENASEIVVNELAKRLMMA